jgi:hypothetical protein
MVTRLLTDNSWFDSLQSLLQNVLTDSGAYPASNGYRGEGVIFTWGEGGSGRDVYTTDVMSAWSYAFTPPCAFTACTGTCFSVPFISHDFIYSPQTPRLFRRILFPKCVVERHSVLLRLFGVGAK